MFSTHDRGSTREVFFRAWRHHREGRPLEGVERVLVEVAAHHPEYHTLLQQPDRNLDRDFTTLPGETNPFLHMGLHVAIEEQLMLDEPRGIRTIYKTLLARHADEHAVQHLLMECLGEWLWHAQQHGTGFDTAAYLECLARLTNAPA